MKKYKVTLTNDERTEIQAIINKQRVAARKRKHAYILCKADESSQGAHWTDKRICDAYDVSPRTVERVRQRFVEHGLEAALQARAPQENRHRKFDGKKEAQLVALACGKAPDGYARWTLSLLANKMIELKHMESISAEAVRKVLKKMNLSLG